MSHAKRFRDRLSTELRFGTSHLVPLRNLYRRLLAGELERGSRFNAVPGLHGNMTWYYAANARTLAPFGRCLRESNLRRSLSIVGGEPELLAACFITVRGGLPTMEYHIDYGEEEIPAGVSSTMLTPLFPFEEHFGQLDYREDGVERKYRYRLGHAILFDGKFEHRSAAFQGKETAERVLVSWSIASSERRYRPAIRRVIASQVR